MFFSRCADRKSFMPSSCKEIRAELAKCMQQSECVLINRHSVAECLKDKELFETQVHDACHRLRRNFYNCRRGLVMNGSRIIYSCLVGYEDEVPRKRPGEGVDSGG